MTHDEAARLADCSPDLPPWDTLTWADGTPITTGPDGPQQEEER